MPKPILRQWGLNKHFFKGKNAQVETLVGPQVAPPKSGWLKPRRKRASPIKVRLSVSEKEIVKQKAQKAGLSVNAFVKCVIIGTEYDPHIRKIFLMLNRELTAQGRNLNQIAKHLNSNGSIEVGMAMLDVIRIPLLKALHAVKAALTHNAPQP